MSDIERKEFEQAVTDRWSDSYSFTRFGDEDYYDEVLEGMWWGWQASRQVDGESVAYITERKLEWLKSGLVLSAVVYRKHSEGSIPLYTHPASAQKEIERLQARVAELCDLIKYAQVKSGVCMCGDNMQDHNQASGHSPVDVWDHAVEQVDKGGTSEALILRKQAEAVQASRQAVSVPQQWRDTMEELEERVAELECMVRAFRDCVDLQMVPSWGSPCRDQIHALVGKNTEEGT